MNTLFLTGIGTDVGKTVISAIITEALKADYWKPIQAGDLENTDTIKVQQFVSNPMTKFHVESYALQHAMSPHAAADLENIHIDLDTIQRPETQNNLVIEGAGGLKVPINHQQTILDLIQPDDKVIVVSKNYLGSINHTLMTIDVLRQNGIEPLGIVFNGDENKATQEIIIEMTKIPMITRVDTYEALTKSVILKEADKMKEKLAQYLTL
ncbi:dethiobiotin synthase [Flavobacteriaceae bacterium UJ101]|nr:dethiobiotin synthase [Flavobacteriaceae bacterium UJ101]